MVGGPPPINTGGPPAGYPPPVMGGPPPIQGGPPGYAGAPGYPPPPPQQQQGPGAAPYGRQSAAEVEGNSRSKAQLIVGIDFVRPRPPSLSLVEEHRSNSAFSQGTTFSGVAFAFATNNEAKEDIITEWPGAGSYTKQKVSRVGLCAVRDAMC